MRDALPHPSRKKRRLSPAAVSALRALVEQSNAHRIAMQLHTSKCVVEDALTDGTFLFATADRLERQLLGQRDEDSEAVA